MITGYYHEEEEFINTSIDYKKHMDEDDEQYEDDSFEDEGNSPLNIHKQKRQQQAATASVQRIGA